MGFDVKVGQGRYRFICAVGPGVWFRVPLLGEVFIGGGQDLTMDRWRDCRDV